jgi:hypothetical protein
LREVPKQSDTAKQSIDSPSAIRIIEVRFNGR